MNNIISYSNDVVGWGGRNNPNNITTMNDAISNALKYSISLVGPIRPYIAKGNRIYSDLGKTLYAREIASESTTTDSTNKGHSVALALDRNRAIVILIDLLNNVKLSTSSSFLSQKSVVDNIDESAATLYQEIDLSKIKSFLRTIDRYGEIAYTDTVSADTKDLYDVFGELPIDLRRVFSSDISRARDFALKADLYEERIVPLIDWITRHD